MRDSDSSDTVEISEPKKEGLDLVETIDDTEVLQAELKHLKKKLRKAEDLLNEVRSTHDILKKELKKKKEKKEEKRSKRGLMS